MASPRTKTTKRLLRVDLDTSVFGGVHDDEFREGSEKFFRAVRDGAFTILISEPLTLEITRAPKKVQDTFVEHRRYAEPLATTGDGGAC